MTKQEKHGTSVYLYYFFKSINNHILCTKKLLDKILRKVVAHDKGTASLANIFGYDVAGKTGTAQVKRITKQDRELDLKTIEIPYEERDHALYVAYGPYSNPRYAVSIIVEHGGSGSLTAAPMATQLFKLIIDRHQYRKKLPDYKEFSI